MTTPAERRLPRVVDMVGDRIGLNYDLPRREATISYVGQHDRLELNNLKYSAYTLGECESEQTAKRYSGPKNPLKLNAKLRRKLYKLSKDEKSKITYKVMERIHLIWIQYSRMVLATPGEQSNVFKLDLHGCLISCTASRNPTLVGSKGIVVQETKNTFLIICDTDRMITIPKCESIFEFSIDGKTFRIHGCNFLFTVQARSKLKYKRKRSTSSV